MIAKLRTLLLSLSTLLVLGGGVLVTPVALADVGQSDINNSLCNGGNSLTVDNNQGGCSGQNIISSSSSIDNIIKNVLNVLSLIVGIVAVIMIIVGGFRYVTSGGQEKGVEAAKNSILYAIIGLVIVAVAQVIVRFVLSKTTGATGTG